MEKGRISSSLSSKKKITNLATFIRKCSTEIDTNYGHDTVDDVNRLNQTYLTCKILRSACNNKWLPGRDLRLERPGKMFKYRTFHGSSGVINRKRPFSRSRSMGTECFSINTPSEEAPRSETQTDSTSKRDHKTRFIHIFWITVILLLACYLYFNLMLSTGNWCSCPGASNRTAHINFYKLKAEFDNRIFGQDVATYAILDILNGFFSTDPMPEQPLVMSLHGGIGVGKTLVARILEQHFASCKANVQWYFPGSEALATWVFRMIRECSTNVFVLDDVDQNDKEIIMQLRDLLIAWPTNALVAQPTHIVFVITTNAGFKGINEIVVNELKQDHQKQDIPLSRFSVPKRFLTIPNLKFVPFLPLNRSVILRCARRFMASYNYYGQNYSDSLLDGLLHEEKYFPDDFPVLARSGCKKIHVGL